MKPLIEIEDLSVQYKTKRGKVKGLRNLNLTLYEGETLGLVGESGSGKSTLGKAILGLLPIAAGKITYRNEPLSKEHRKEMQLIFQDPYSSLNPRLSAAEIVTEPMVIQKMIDRKDRIRVAGELLELVGLSAETALRFPHEFSGGQRQRLSIARALSTSPHFLVSDEPISALDVSVKAQIVNLLKSLQERLELTSLFISHDLSMIRHLATRVAVMYLGEIVEIADVETLYNNPQHPYTQALLSASLDMQQERPQILLEGEIPSPFNPPQGCSFCTRCPYVKPICKKEKPLLKEIQEGHWASCHLIHHK